MGTPRAESGAYWILYLCCPSQCAAGAGTGSVNGYEKNEGDMYNLKGTTREEICIMATAWTLEPHCLALNPGLASYKTV